MRWSRIRQIHRMWLIGDLTYGGVDAALIWKSFNCLFMQAGSTRHVVLAHMHPPWVFATDHSEVWDYGQAGCLATPGINLPTCVRIAPRNLTGHLALQKFHYFILILILSSFKLAGINLTFEAKIGLLSPEYNSLNRNYFRGKIKKIEWNLYLDHIYIYIVYVEHKPYLHITEKYINALNCYTPFKYLPLRYSKIHFSVPLPAIKCYQSDIQAVQFSCQSF